MTETLPTKPIADETIKYVTYEEAKQYDKLLDKQFIRKPDASGKPHKTTKDFFYKILSISPSQPKADKYDAPSSFTMDFQIQKYHRNKTRASKVYDARGNATDMEIPEEVSRWGFNARVAKITGNDLEVLDDDASFGIDSRKFMAEFQVE